MATPFKNWNTKEDEDEEGSESIQPGSHYPLTEIITLYAQYSDKCTITYNTNDAESGEAPESITVTVNTSVTIADGSVFSRTGYTFF